MCRPRLLLVSGVPSYTVEWQQTSDFEQWCIWWQFYKSGWKDLRFLPLNPRQCYPHPPPPLSFFLLYLSCFRSAKWIMDSTLTKTPGLGRPMRKVQSTMLPVYICGYVGILVLFVPEITAAGLLLPSFAPYWESGIKNVQMSSHGTSECLTPVMSSPDFVIRRDWCT